MSFFNKQSNALMIDCCADPDQSSHSAPFLQPTIADIILGDHRDTVALLERFEAVAGSGDALMLEKLTDAIAITIRLHSQASRSHQTAVTQTPLLPPVCLRVGRSRMLVWSAALASLHLCNCTLWCVPALQQDHAPCTDETHTQADARVSGGVRGAVPSDGEEAGREGQAGAAALHAGAL